MTESGPGDGERRDRPDFEGGWGGPSGQPGQGGRGGQYGGPQGAQGGWGGQYGQPQGAQGGQSQPPGPYGQPPPGGQAAWGGQARPGGWGSGYRQAAPSPGPVPVRPMGLGELLDAAFKLLRADFGPILLAAGAIIVPIQILTLVLTANLSTDLLASLQQNPEALDDLLGGAAAALPGIGIVTIISFVLTLIAEGAVVRIGAARYLGGAEGAGDALKAAGRRAGRLIGVRILVAILAGAPFLVLVVLAVALAAAGNDAVTGLLVVLALLSLLFSLYLFIRWYLVAPAMMLEDAGVRASMRRSAQLVRGNWWRVLGYVIVAAMILSIVSFAVSGIFSTLGGAFPTEWFGWVLTGIGAILAALVTEPVSALVTLMLYADLRVRKEGLDLQLRSNQATPYQGAGPAQFYPGASPG